MIIPFLFIAVSSKIRLLPFRLLTQFQGAVNDVVLFVDDGEVFVHLPEVSGNEGLELQAHEGKGALQFVIILGFDALLVALLDDGVDQALWHVEILMEIIEGGI